jgi:PAS domain S-box-containing protein
MNERKESEEKLKLMEFSIDNIPDAVYWTTSDGNFRNVNAAACDMLGYSREKLLSMSVHDINPDYTREDGQSDLVELKRTGTLQLKSRHKTRDGCVIPVEITSRFFVYNGVEYICCTARDITRQIEAEKEASFYKMLVEHTRDPIHVVSHTKGARLVYVNDAACAHFGRKREELLAMRVPDLDATIDMECLNELHEDLRGKKALRHETLHRRASGDTVPVEVTSTYMEIDGEELAVGYINDISRRKAMEAALRQSNEDLEKRVEERTAELAETVRVLRFTQFAIDRAADQAFWMTEDGRFFYVNDAACRALGYAREELLRMSVPDIGPTCPPEVFAGHWRDLRERGAATFESLHRAKDGRVYPVEIRANYVVFDGKEYNCAFATDITERKLAEEALRKSRQMLMSVLDNFPGVVFWKDRNSLYLGCNRNFSLAAGLAEPSEIVGKRDHELPWKNDAERYLADDRQVMESGVPKLNIIEPLLHADGRVAWFETSKVPLFDADGKVIAVLGVSNDITERKRAEEALRKAHDELEARVSERTEQLTSLTAELSLVEELERRRIATELHDQVGQNLILSKIKLDSLSRSLPSESFEKLTGEIRKYLDQSIQDIRSLTFQLSPPLLYELGFEAAIEWLGEEFEEKYGLYVEFKDDGRTKPLDEETRVALYQMVRELLVNVAKHAKAKKVRISVEKFSDKIKISVVDDGTGFDAMNGMRRKNKKRGFGLFNIRQRIEYMGGELAIESKIKRGTRVTLLLPLNLNP